LIYYVFSEKDDTCFGRSGYKILPFTVMDSVEDYPLDFLILNGGIGTYYYADNLRLREIIKRADSEKKIIVASNFAPILFMKDSMLQGRSINFVRNKITEDLEKKYKFKYLPGPVIVSENLITSPSSEFVRLYLNEFLKKYYETFSSESE
jgi:putative intracellular protease/amidase